MAVTMPKHMMPQIAELESGESLIWAYAPQRLKPKNRGWERRVSTVVYALGLFWMGYLTHEHLSEGRVVMCFILIGIIVLAIGYRVFFKDMRANQTRIRPRIYDHIIITDQRLKLGSLNRTPSGESADFRAVAISQIESAAMDYHQGSSCLAVHIKGESKPVYLIGGFDTDAALTALGHAA